MRLSRKRIRAGFTLVETVIAMGIITIMITAFLAAFGPAVQGIRKSLSAKEVNRLATTLEYELSVLRPDEVTNYPTAFAKAFDWIVDSFNGKQTSHDDIVLVYQYRGDPASVRNDGTLNPYTGSDGIPGKDYVLQSVVRRFGNNAVKDELKPRVVEGRVFYVRLAQLYYNNGALVVNTGSTAPLSIVDPHNPGTVTNYENYPEAVIAFQAQFYVMKSSLWASVNAFDPSDLNLTDDDPLVERHPKFTGKPVFTRNMAIRR